MPPPRPASLPGRPRPPSPPPGRARPRQPLAEALRGWLERRLLRLWFGPPSPADHLLVALLAPLSLVVGWVARARRRRIDLAKRGGARVAPVGAGASTKPTGPTTARGRPVPTVPVVVVGNLVVGGTGKTPLLVALVEALRKRGFRPAVIARGYRRGAQASQAGSVTLVDAQDDASRVGDEPLLVARRTGVPVAVGADRGAALSAVLAGSDCDVVLSDDGLQHEGLRRDIELAVFDRRGAGNRECLPAGPLREPLSSLERIDAVVLNGEGTIAPAPHPRTFRFRIAPATFMGLDGRSWTPSAFAALLRQAGTDEARRVTAIAGIGHPQRFFDTLCDLGIGARPVPLADHARIDPRWLAGLPGHWIVMTEKDAVKCVQFDLALRSRCVALRIDALVDHALIDWLEGRLRGQPPA
jgi:tetraacyldisaccharide 4'-kinase